MSFDDIIQQANDAARATRSDLLGAAVVIASALRSLSSSTRAIASGNSPNGATGLEMVSNAINQKMDALTKVLDRYVTTIEDGTFDD